MPAVNPMAAPMTAEEVQNRFDGSVTATRVRQAMATGEINALESELRQMDDLLPTESLQLVQVEGGMPKIQIVSMFDPENIASLEPEEIVSDIEAETEAELAILDAQDGTVPPQDIAKVLSAKLDQLYADGGRSPIIPALENELGKINQQLELQAQEQAASTIQVEEATQAPRSGGISARFMPEQLAERFPTSERGFYSGLQQTIDQKVQGKFASPDQIKAIVSNPQNVKAEELKWSGVLGEIDRLAAENQGKVPKDKVMEYLRNEGAVKFEEVTLGGATKTWTQSEIDALERQAQRTRNFDAYEQAVLEFEDQQLGSDANSTGNQTKYAKYQLPGGENYREVVMAMPEKNRGIAESDIEDQAKVDAGRQWESWTPQERSQAMDEVRSRFNRAGEYTSSHFPEIPNYVAHMRLNERTDVEGNDGLFIEELQSDRHQAGREKGYDVKEEPFKPAEIKQREDGKWGFWKDGTWISTWFGDSQESAVKRQQETYRAVPPPKTIKTGIPDAPFRKDWSLQLFKRALRDAVESGKQWIGWTTGDTQAERYDLSKQLSQVEWYPDTNEVFGYDKNGEKVINTIANEQALPDVVGKELAQKLIDSDPYQEGQKILKGLDLKVGGEGMKGFYDQILPKEIGKYVAKMGGKVEKSEIETPKGKPTDYEDFNAYNKAPESKQTPIWRVNITPEMAGAVKGGQLQFMPQRPQDENIKPADLQTSAKPEPDAVIKPFSNALVSSAGLINFLPAYHGTPFEVDKFKLANIGTGEGAQAYGWGLYFAQARKVAQEYKEKLTDWNSPGVYEWKGMSLRSDDYKNPIRHAISLVYHQGINQAKQIGKTLQKDSEKGEPYTVEQGGLEYAKKFNDALNQIKSKKEITFEQGNLYKVDLDVKDEDLLDWDKPLSEQSEKVKEKLSGLDRKVYGNALWQMENEKAGGDFISGGQLYDIIAANERDINGGSAINFQSFASEKLKQLGIPGIRYLDGTSRKQGEGTYNYVVFDENLITILDKNDKPVAGELPTKQPLSGIQFMPQRGEGKKPKTAKKEPEKKYITIDSGDDETVPVLQEIRNGKPLTDPKGDAKFAQQKYDLLSSPFIDNYSGDNPEDTTKPNYKELAYDVSGVAQKKINAAIDSGAVDAAANIMVNKTNEAMKNADIAAGSGWYSRMRENLLNALGIEGRELLSQLLGATSAKTPVNENFLQAMDGYEGIKSGRYDSNRKAYLEMINAEGKNELNDLIDDRNYIAVIKNKISTLNKAAKKVTGKKQNIIQSEVKKLKDLIAIKPEDRSKKNRFSIVINASGLIPLRSNGKKFNANSMAVMKVIAGTWLDNRKAPKTPNFAGNLSGRTVQATIDVWAARFLRQILHEGFGKPWRIQPKSETGVSNEDFALGQVIMQRAAKKLGMNPDDLQAILWFAEKHNWDDRGWTGAEGAEKSSFDEIFSVFFPKGKKPLTFSEASEVLKSQKNKDESIDQKEDEETYEDTDEE
jgi:hypothetical protein